ncbi:hypothetical protein QN277_009560 [Acacia crassicarpa]|uniref:RRM domain-containing protein n=1 Tax=Acacia crassicarpa TaxID=499986 RepID=A0AAE1M5K9_9FABA|nr:hypothetical protein QN277_009560 [Acacia crassicarpa]
MATSQNRCVFVGNVPYDTTEERLIEICEEVGPVVSFRFVKDRETGKTKGYGFCEYKDEETALSARRNLQGYEINGRKLRVNFTDKNREQTPQKQVAAPEEADYQPTGLHIAITAISSRRATTDGDHL